MKARIGLVLMVAGLVAAVMVSPSGAAVTAQLDRKDSAPAVHQDVSPPLRDIAPAPGPDLNTKQDHPLRDYPVPAASSTADPVVQSSAAAAAASLSTNFEGLGAGFTGPAGAFSVTSAPPDPNGAVGPSRFVEIVNTSFAIFDKSGTPVYGPVPTNTLWGGFGGGCEANDDGDATVAYDRLADRWIVSQFSVSTTPYLQCVAVSTSGDPTGSYYRYSFSYSDFPDYPKLGVWPDAYYTSFNMFRGGTTFAGGEVCAYDRARMLTGQAATQQCFNVGPSYGGLLPSDLDGSTPPPAGSPNYVLGFGTGSLLLWKFHVDWSTPASTSFSGPTTIPVAAFSAACSGGGTCIPQAGTAQRLDSLADRLMYRLAYRNFGDHESLVVDHSVTAGGSVGVRWYELRSPNGTPTVYQQSTYAPDASYRWMGSVAMDGSGGIALGFSVSSTTLHPGVHYTGRLAGDPLGTMTLGEGSIIDGAGSQTGMSLNRWGDYTSMSVDPSDDCTFWYTDQYIASNGNFNWHTRIGSFKLPGCSAAPDFSVAASPASLSVAQGSSGQSTISTAVTSGSARTVSLSVSGQPAGATVSFNPSSVTAGGSSTMTVSVGAGIAPGSYPLTVTATGSGGATHSTVVSLTVASDFSIAASPASLSVPQGSSGQSTISTAVTSGSAQTVSLSVSGQPAGATVSFNPSSVTAGGSSTMTVSVGAGTVPGGYTLTVTGTGSAGATHSTTVSLTVTTAPSSDFSLAASPASLSVAQGSSGQSTISTAVTSGSAQTVSLSVSGQPAGATVSFNPSSVTAGGSSTMTVSVGAGTVPGGYTLTVTGTGSAGATHTTTVSLTVVLSDFSLAASPASLSVAQGSSGQSTISTAVTSGSARTVSLSVAGRPAGATVSFNPSSVTAGGSSTMTVSVGTSTAAGSYTLTVTGTGSAGATHTTSVALTVPPSGPGVANGDFETGSLSGWRAIGVLLPRIVPTPVHGGSYAAQLGAASAYSGNSTLTQTVAIPTGSSRISFWYQPHCPDTLTHDQIQMQIRSTAGATLATLLNVCSNSGAWTSVIYDTSAWAGQTVVLWFNDHDDNSATDPTYSIVDDVAITSYTPTPNVVVNPGFETGSLSSWSASGAFVPVMSTTAHSGSFSARIGSTSAVTGNSNLTQRVTVPAGSATLSFWYQPHCADTIAFDQIRMQIRSTAGATLATVLNVCSNSGAWTPATFDMTPYAGQTVVLWFNDHDDGAPSDPTYFLLDDVSLSGG